MAALVPWQGTGVVMECPSPARRCLWLGPLTSRRAINDLPALSPAAVEWERGFLQALTAGGFQVEAVSHRAEPLWPRGRLQPGSAPVPADVICATHLVGYLNAPLIRARSLSSVYVQAVADLVPVLQPDFLATFNLLPWHLAAARAARARWGVPWLSFLLDDVSDDPELTYYAKASKVAAGHVVVSAAAAARLQVLLPDAAILHLDGGIQSYREAAKTDDCKSRPSVVYCGSHSDEAGMTMLVDTIPLVTTKDVSFVITGNRGFHAGLRALAARDPRVELVGFVPSVTLDAICGRASVFVNPRPPNHALNIASFPSKLMRYLAFGKPIASMWTPGLAEEYRPLLVVAEDGSARSLAAAIEKAIALDAAAREGFAQAAKAVMVPGRLWSTQAARFARFVDAALDARVHSRLESGAA